MLGLSSESSVFEETAMRRVVRVENAVRIVGEDVGDQSLRHRSGTGLTDVTRRRAVVSNQWPPWQVDSVREAARTNGCDALSDGFDR
jgi:hypothetical protein